MPAPPLEPRGSRSRLATAQAGNAFFMALPFPGMDIHKLRQHIRQKRSALGPAGQALAAQQVDINLRAYPPVNRARHIGLYLANDGEIDPADFMRWAFTQAKHCYLPVLDIEHELPMKFAEIRPESRFKPNRFGIPEPVVEASQLQDAAVLDLILLPLVAFDMRGNRIGMGGGFYDRTLAFTSALAPDQRPTLVGLAHDFQRHDTIEPASWDIPLDALATESRVITFT